MNWLEAVHPPQPSKRQDQPDMQLFQQIDARTFVHCVDARGRLSHVNDAWLDFATENGWSVTAADVLGRPLMDSIADGHLRYLYGLLMARLRDGHGPFRFPYRCDAPDCRRYMQMHMLYHQRLGEIEFRNRILRIERRTAQELLNVQHPTDERSVTLCSACKRVDTDQGWLELEDAVLRLHLFDCDRLPRTRHGVCPSCAGRFVELARCG
ncbi:hypothetical protein [uncultured Thiohalocapsa sp.]|uniref:hypothetical protein n=1 Tax=uncultured Thiohalocapsa sp. TaxID=768990 RepID=UPI0025DB2BE7|nr:hypothetical protein [uncultured Thiohalocapsa sp.]